MQANFSTKFEFYPHLSTKTCHIIGYQRLTWGQLNKKFVDKRQQIFSGLKCPVGRALFGESSRLILQIQLYKIFKKKIS
jgi:hypothetical protein